VFSFVAGPGTTSATVAKFAVAFTPVNCVWFSALNMSRRTSNLIPFGAFRFFDSDMSRLLIGGACTKKRADSAPSLWGCGCAKHASRSRELPLVDQHAEPLAAREGRQLVDRAQEDVVRTVVVEERVVEPSGFGIAQVRHAAAKSVLLMPSALLHAQKPLNAKPRSNLRVTDVCSPW